MSPKSDSFAHRERAQVYNHGGAHKISDGGGWACWSPDSRWLYFSPPGENGFRIAKASPADGNNLPVRAERQKPAVDAGGRFFFVMSLPALNGLSDMEILVASPENVPAQKLARISGSRLSSWLLMQPVSSPDGKWLAPLLTDGRPRISGRSQRPEDQCAASPTLARNLHHQESFLVVGRTLHLRRSGKRRGRHCPVEQSETLTSCNILRPALTSRSAAHQHPLAQ
jgi:hypothetical protein